MLKIICINGPPQSGKDTLGNIIIDEAMNHHGCSAQIMKFAQPLIDMCKLILGINQNMFDHIMEYRKDTPMEEFGHAISMRQLMINISEDLIKPSLGDTWFAMNLADKIRYIHTGNLNPSTITIVVTDSGFQNEFNCFKKELKDIANVKLVRITRHGCNYDNDSREYVKNPDYYITNDGDIDYLRTRWHNSNHLIKLWRKI